MRFSSNWQFPAVKTIEHSSNPLFPLSAASQSPFPPPPPPPHTSLTKDTENGRWRYITGWNKIEQTIEGGSARKRNTSWHPVRSTRGECKWCSSSVLSLSFCPPMPTLETIPTCKRILCLAQFSTSGAQFWPNYWWKTKKLFFNGLLNILANFLLFCWVCSPQNVGGRPGDNNMGRGQSRHCLKEMAEAKEKEF